MVTWLICGIFKIFFWWGNHPIYAIQQEQNHNHNPIKRNEKTKYKKSRSLPRDSSLPYKLCRFVLWEMNLVFARTKHLTWQRCRVADHHGNHQICFQIYNMSNFPQRLISWPLNGFFGKLHSPNQVPNGWFCLFSFGSILENKFRLALLHFVFKSSFDAITTYNTISNVQDIFWGLVWRSFLYILQESCYGNRP